MVLKLLKCTKLNQSEAEILHIRLLTKEKVCKSRLLLCEKLSQKMQICKKSSANRFFFFPFCYPTVKKDLGSTYMSCTALCWPLLLASKTLPKTQHTLPTWRFCVPLREYAKSRRWPHQNKNLHCFFHPDFHLCIPTAFPLASNCAH